jgi:histone H3/H4
MASHRQWLVECHYPSRPSDLLAFCSSHPIHFFHALFTTNDAVTGIVRSAPIHILHPTTLCLLFCLSHYCLFLQRSMTAACLLVCMSSNPSMSSPSSPLSLSSDLAGKKYSDAYIRNFALVARIMKGALPENAKIAKEAKECMQECVSEFISFITSEGESNPFTFYNVGLIAVASEKCQQEKRKTVNGEDILFAMTSLGFENYAEALKIYLARYREVGNFDV